MGDLIELAGGIGVPPFRLMVVTDAARVGQERLLKKLAAAVLGGADLVQVREKSLGGRELLDLTWQVSGALGGKAGVVVNDRLDVAMAAGVAGAHLPERSFTPAMARALLGNNALIGKSAHGPGAARDAEADGADYVVFGPVFDTPSKRAYGKPRGLSELADVCSSSRLPVVAIGGVTPDNAGAVAEAGAGAVAVISWVLDSPDPGRAAEELLCAFLDKAQGRGPRA